MEDFTMQTQAPKKQLAQTKTIYVLFIILTLSGVALSSFLLQKYVRAQAPECSGLSAEYGLLVSTVSLDTPGAYDVWARVKSDDRQPEFMFSIHGESGSLCEQSVDGNVPDTSWNWIKAPNTLEWSAGQATVQMAGTKEGVGLDCVIITQDTSLNPSSASDCEGLDSAIMPISISSPINTTTVEGTIDITATINTGISTESVSFYVDGVRVGSPDTSAPYTVSWDTTAYTNGGHSITAVLTDTNAVTHNSRGVNVVVSNQQIDTTEPEVTITTPNDQVVNTGRFEVGVNATDDVAISRVALRHVTTGEILSEDREAPFSLVLPNTLSNDDYTLAAVAYDTSGNTAVSTSIRVRLRLADFNRDGNINVQDLSPLLGAWMETEKEYDLNADGTVDIVDLARLLSQWGASPDSVDNVPTADEPETL